MNCDCCLRRIPKGRLTNLVPEILQQEGHAAVVLDNARQHPGHWNLIRGRVP